MTPHPTPHHIPPHQERRRQEAIEAAGPSEANGAAEAQAAILGA